MMKQIYHCGLYQYLLTIVGTHLQPKLVLITMWQVYRLLQAVTSRFAALRQKYNCLFAKFCCSALQLRNVAQK